MQGNLGNVLRQPPQTVKVWKESDYLDNMRYIASQWNKCVYEFAPDDMARQIKPRFWVQDYVQNSSYFFGKNQSTDYGFATMDEVNNKLPVPMFRGQDIYELIKHTVGVIGDFVRSASDILSATSVSDGAISKKMLLMDMAKSQAENKAIYDQMELMSGYKFQPIDGIDFQNKQQVDTFFETYIDALEKIYVKLAQYSFYYNYGKEFFEKASEYYGIGGLVHMRCYAFNGKTKWRLVEPQNAIWDNYNSFNQHREDRFAGEYCEKTIPELLTMFEWTEEERKNVEALSIASNAVWQTYNIPTGNQLVWWRTSATGVPMVVCIHGQWRSLKYEGVDENGKEIWTPCLREGWLIGNKYLKENRLTPNQIEDKFDVSRMKMDYVTATADTVMGVSMGIVGRLKEYQKLKDYFQTKLNQLVANSKGKRYVMYADKLPEGMKAPDILAQLSQSGITIMPSRDMDDDSPDGNQRMIETIDMTLDPSIMGLGGLISSMRSYMDNILSLPANVRGANQNYQSKDAMAMNIKASGYGMSSYYNTFYTWMLRVLEQSADKNKLIMPEGDNDTLTLLVGDAKVEIIKKMDLEKMQFENYALGLGIEDFMSDPERQALIQYYMQKASTTNSPEDELVMVNLMQIKTKLAFKEYLDSVVAAKLQRMQQEQQAAAERQQQAAQIAADAQVQSAQVGAENARGMQQDRMAHERGMAENDQAHEVAMRDVEANMPPQQ